MYGLTEVSGRLCILPAAELDARVGSVGRPIGDMRVVARRGDGAEAPADETGELFVTGSLLMQCYLDEPDITASTLTATASGPETSARGRDGDVWIEGRKDDIIKRGGEKVWIIHVQQALQGLGRFADVAVLAAPDDILGHVPVALWCPRAGRLQGLEGAARATRGVAVLVTAQPVVGVAAIPRTGSGKAIRAKPRAILAEELPVSGFKAGFTNRNPLVLVVAGLCCSCRHCSASSTTSPAAPGATCRSSTGSGAPPTRSAYVSWTVGHSQASVPGRYVPVPHTWRFVGAGGPRQRHESGRRRQGSRRPRRLGPGPRLHQPELRRDPGHRRQRAGARVLGAGRHQLGPVHLAPGRERAPGGGP